MSLKCLFGHNWYDGKCTKCGQAYTSYGKLEDLEAKICSRNDLVSRAMIINSLPQEPLIYLAENANNYSVVDMTIPKIKDKKIIGRIALKRGNRDICYKAVMLLEDSEDFEKFIDYPDGYVSKLAQQKLFISKLETKEELEKEKGRHYMYEPNANNFINDRLSEMSNNKN